MSKEQWQEVIQCVEKEQNKSLQHMNKPKYNELSEILIQLQKLQNT
jgi:hypothetical protein